MDRSAKKTKKVPPCFKYAGTAKYKNEFKLALKRFVVLNVVELIQSGVSVDTASRLVVRLVATVEQEAIDDLLKSFATIATITAAITEVNLDV